MIALGLGLLAVVAICSSTASRAAAGLPVITGTLLDANGNPARARVWAFFTVPRLEPGEAPVRAPLLGTAVTDRRGRFVITSKKETFYPFDATPDTVQRVLGGIETNGGWANIDVLASDGTTTRYLAASRRTRGGSRIGFFGRGKPGSPGGDLSVGTIVLSPRIRGAMLNRRPASADRLDPGLPTCFEFESAIARPTLRETVVGELHAAGDSSETFTIGHTADSEIDVGMSVGGDVTTDGSYHVANSINETDTWSSERANNKQLLTTFEYQRYLHKSVGPGCGGTHSFTTVNATAWEGGSADGPAVPDPSNGCTLKPYRDRRIPVDPANSWSRDTSQAARYSSAVNVLGFHLGASTGLSSTVTLKFTSGTRHQHYYLCGDTGPPRLASRVFSGFSG